MIRGMMVGGFIWFVVSLGIMIFSHLSTSDKVSLIKATLYGLFTGVIAMVLLFCIVVLF